MLLVSDGEKNDKIVIFLDPIPPMAWHSLSWAEWRLALRLAQHFIFLTHTGVHRRILRPLK